MHAHSKICIHTQCRFRTGEVQVLSAAIDERKMNVQRFLIFEFRAYIGIFIARRITVLYEKALR